MAFNSYAGFGGRSSRSEFWWWMLFTFIVGCVCSFISVMADTTVISGLVSLAFLLPNIAISVRRLHDIGKSGWWYLLNLIPIIGSIVLIVWYCQPSQEFANEYGPVPNVME